MRTFTILFLSILLQGHILQAQHESDFIIRLHVLPQVSSLNPYDPDLFPEPGTSFFSLGFGIDARKQFSKVWDLGIGYHYSSQAGNFRRVECFIVNDFIVNRPSSPRCLWPRGRIRLLKVPVYAGYTFIVEKKYKSRISAGPQFQFLVMDADAGVYTHRPLSMAYVIEWSNNFQFHPQFSLDLGIKFDGSFTDVDFYFQHTRSHSLGMLLGVNYHLEKP